MNRLYLLILLALLVIVLSCNSNKEVSRPGELRLYRLPQGDIEIFYSEELSNRAMFLKGNQLGSISVENFDCLYDVCEIAIRKGGNPEEVVGVFLDVYLNVVHDQSSYGRDLLRAVQVFSMPQYEYIEKKNDREYIVRYLYCSKLRGYLRVKIESGVINFSSREMFIKSRDQYIVDPDNNIIPKSSDMYDKILEQEYIRSERIR